MTTSLIFDASTEPVAGPSRFTVTGSQKFWGRLVAALIALWIVLVAFGAQLLGWAGPALGLPKPAMNMPVWASLVQAGLMGIPLLLLVFLWRTERYRAIFQTWLWATGFLLLLAPTRWLFPTQGQLIMLLQISASLICLVLVNLAQRFATENQIQNDMPSPSRAMLALGAVALFAYPWLVWGALGSWFDSLLALLAGLLFGWTAGTILRHYWLRSLQFDTRGLFRDLVTGGFVAGITLLIMASAFSFNGTQLVLMLAMPALGWAAIGISATREPMQASSQWRGMAWLIGLAVAVVVLFVDPDGMGLEVEDIILRWSFQAALIALLIGWLLGLMVFVTRDGLANFQPNQWALFGVLLLWLGGGMLYLTAGEPGLYGDQIFVILKEQADVSSAATIKNYDERRRFVYRTLVQQADTSQANLRKTLDQFGIEYTPYYLVNAIEVRGGLLYQLWLSTRPEVDRILPSPILRPLSEPEPLSTGSEERPTAPQWNLTSIGADRVWKELGVTGKGIVIGQSDSGVQFDHPELAEGYRGHTSNADYNWFDPWHGTNVPTDFGGHGTHTLGSILGKTVGVAPAATWFACANLARNLGNPAHYLDCMQFMLAPFPQGGNPLKDGDPTRAAHVLNNSWGCPQEIEGCDPLSLLAAVRALRAAGLFVVASAGNEGPACSTVKDAIAIYDEVFSVGASNSAGDLAPFSSNGPVTVDDSGRVKPDIIAPGLHVLSSFPGNTYEFESGTSMAGPHVVGVVALLWSANPTLIGDIERTEQILIQSATPFTGTLASYAATEASTKVNDAKAEPSLLGQLDAATTNKGCLTKTNQATIPNNVAGYGIVNAYKAVKLALGKR